MDLMNGVQPVTVLKSKSAELIRQARETGEPVVITQNGKPTAVLQDVASFQRQRKALLMLQLLSQGDEDYTHGRVLGHEEAKKRFAARLAEIEEGG